jgi:hypothetical protein
VVGRAAADVGGGVDVSVAAAVRVTVCVGVVGRAAADVGGRVAASVGVAVRVGARVGAAGASAVRVDRVDEAVVAAGASGSPAEGRPIDDSTEGRADAGVGRFSPSVSQAADPRSVPSTTPAARNATLGHPLSSEIPMWPSSSCRRHDLRRR